MSNITSNGSVRPGTIYRIALENFVTYKQVELYPGPSLNMIIGPNGTGKSTFVCAIILGLCGKTNVIGRAKKISDYIRSGCSKSYIEIELYRDIGENNVIIRRTFNTEGVTTWHIDHKSVKEKQVQELIGSMNIQVDNLCQLLPQDRVQDFSKMDPQQLLRSTLSAVGGQTSVDQLDSLISSRLEQRNLGSKLVNSTQTLQENERLNERLKLQIDAMQQRKEIEREIDIIEKKKLWLEYNELRDKYKEQNNDKKEAQRLVNSHMSRVDPLERLVKKARDDIGKVEQEKLNSNRDIHKLKDQIKESLETIRQQEYKIKEIQSSFESKLERQRNKENELEEAKTKLDKLNMDRAKLVEKVGDESHLKMEIAELNKPISKTNIAIDNTKKQKMEAQYDTDSNVMPQIRLYQNKIRNMEDASSKKLEVLRQFSQDTYRGVLWLRENIGMFRDTVYEPMVMEINFTDPKFARYLENTVASRDLIAFTFVNSQDMNKFLRIMRQELGLKQINAICSPESNVRYRPTVPLEQLSYLGFYAYIVDTITAPDPIIKYLCKQYNIHRIPIGDDHTYNNSGKVPSNINFFFTANHRFSIRVSAYSGAKSSSTVEIRPPKLLANSVDMEQLNKFQEQLSKFERILNENRNKITTLDDKIAVLESNLNELYTRKKRINDGVEQVRALTSQIKIQQNRVLSIENEPFLDIEQEKTRCVKKQKDIVIKQCSIHREICELTMNLQRRMLNSEMWKVKLQLSRDAIVQQESELRELKSELRNVQATLENIEATLNRTKAAAQEKLNEAKSACNNKMPHEPNFPYKGEFEKLPGDVFNLQERAYELNTRINCMDESDDQVIKEYEEREKVIAKLKHEIKNSSSMGKVLEERIAQLRSEWLPSLEELLRNIDRTFGDMFARLGCAGEIKLDTGGHEDDFDKYGISILVKFRENELLQQLTRHTQSGGERALTTALYLMALQRLTTVPFRCVDEINQGMDPINERKMFQLLVQVTTECENAQYFLLTPKLLTNLEYNEKIMIHTIMNGKHIMNYKQWDCDKFLENAHAFAG